VQRPEEARALGEGGFDRLVIESLDESLAMVLDKIVREAVYDALEKYHSIAKNQIPKRLNDFTLMLERSFGTTPSKTIERDIAKRLYSKLGLIFVEKEDWRLPDYVREARTKMIGGSESVE
jgi:DNA polymerase II large subunit